MAKVGLNAITSHFRGLVGDVVFKRIGGKLYATRRPAPRKTKPKAEEKERRKRFAAANKYAQKVVGDPELKAGYAATAKKLRRRIYNLALSDYLTAPQITDVTYSLHWQQGGKIVVTTPNDDKIAAMHVVLRDAAGRVIERGEPTPARKSWRYDTQVPRTGGPLTIEVTAADRLGKTTTRKVEVAFKP